MKKDNDIWTLFKQGDKNALSEIYENNYQSLYQYSFRLLKDAPEVEDIIQDLFIDLWKTRENLVNIEFGSIKFYLFRALRRRIYQKAIAKTNILDNYVDIESTNSKNNFEFLASSSPEELLIDREFNEERINKLHAAMRCLSPRQLEVIHLRFLEEISVKEISSIMKINEQTVRNVIQNALHNLREHITPIFLTLLLLMAI